MSTVLLTGAAGFIGLHTGLRLLEAGHTVIGVDNLNAYYDPSLKHDRLALLQVHPGFRFFQADIADRDAMTAIADQAPNITHYVHLAAQAGVRYSLKAPFDYSHSNLEGQLVMLELARANPRCQHFIYASSSSVYGANTKLPFSVTDRVDQPVSLYAATKRSGELMAHAYSHLYRIPTTGLRFFTVYGPWGRPDMAPYLFARAISNNEAITVFNHGKMRRDFTYIDDIVSGVVGLLDHVPTAQGDLPPYALYNIGNNRAENLMDFITTMERALDRKADIRFAPMQDGDVVETYADIAPLSAAIGYAPTTTIAEGIPRFVAWFKDYYRV